MTILKVVEVVLIVFSILLGLYSALGFLRLARFWPRIPNLDRYKEIFAYMVTFMSAFISLLILVLLEVIAC